MLLNKNLFKPIFALNVFLGAFLLFLIQPLVGKIITPLYGGGAETWILCLFFFQISLLCGYALTFLLSRLKKNSQAIVYMVLIVISLFILQIPSANNLQADYSNPVQSILLTLLIYLAVPMVFVSSVSTLMQSWFGIIMKEDPYFLYSISNTGSVLALLLFPIVFEPNLSLSLTVSLWKYAYWILAITVIISSVFVLKNKQADQEDIKSNEAALEGEPLNLSNCLMWIFLSFMGTSLLLSYTSHITQNIAPVPLLWILPLSLYLGSFILIFNKKSFYKKSLFIYAYYGFLILVALLFHSGTVLTAMNEILLNLFLLFILCMICHGELYNLRPKYSKLPVFYLLIALGGALGGFFINLIAPVLFNDYLEFKIINAIVLFFTIYLVLKHNLCLLHNKKVNIAIRALIIISAVYYSGSFIKKEYDILTYRPKIIRERNFYGTAMVDTVPGKQRRLSKGKILHGIQFYDKKTGELSNKPGEYFSPGCPIDVAIQKCRENKNNEPLKIAILGLGAGTVSYYGKKGDVIDYYEIDPKMIDMAKNYFTFLRNSKAKVNIILGDGRLKLKENSDKKYDVIFMDAYNGDAVPVHLLTRQALKLYLDRLSDNGLIVYHLTNTYLDLYKVVDNLADDLNLNVITARAPRNGYIVSVVSEQPLFENYPKLKTYKDVGVWTDDYSNLLSVFRFKSDLLYNK